MSTVSDGIGRGVAVGADESGRAGGGGGAFAVELSGLELAGAGVVAALDDAALDALESAGAAAEESFALSP